MAEKGKKLLVAMSGGVDSSAALRLLKDGGFDCTGVTFVTDSSEESEKACRDAAAVAEGLGVPHTVLDVSREFYPLGAAGWERGVEQQEGQALTIQS